MAAGDPLDGRVLAQPAPCRPHLRASRGAPWRGRHVGTRHLVVRTPRVGVRRTVADPGTAATPGGRAGAVPGRMTGRVLRASAETVAVTDPVRAYLREVGK